MKKMLTRFAVLSALPIMLAGCLVAPVQPPYGIVINNYKAPLDYGARSVSSSSGSASTMSILGLVALGDGSINKAASNGGLKKVTGVDYEYFNVLGIYQKYTTIAYGDTQ